LSSTQFSLRFRQPRYRLKLAALSRCNFKLTFDQRSLPFYARFLIVVKH